MLMCVGPTDNSSLSSCILITVVGPNNQCQIMTLDYLLPKELQDFRDVFQVPDRPAPVTGVEHEIETTADPPFGPIYNLSSHELAVLHTYLDTALEKG